MDPAGFDAPRETDYTQSDFQRLLGYVEVVWRRKWIISAAALGAALAAFLISRSFQPIYRAQTSLEVQGPQQAIPDFQVSDVTAPYVKNQAKLIRSASLLSRVVSRLREAKPDAAGRNGSPAAGGVDGEAWEEGLMMAAESVDVTLNSGETILEISCDSTDPQTAAQFANLLVEEYLKWNLEERWERYRRAGDWLRQAQTDLRAKVQESERRLQEYARSENLLLSSQKINSDEESVEAQRLSQLQAELSSAQADRILKEAHLRIAKSSPPEQQALIPESSPLRDHQLRLADLRREMAELTATLTPQHYKVKRVQAQIEEVERSVQVEQGRVVARIQSDYDSALNREKLLRTEYTSQGHRVSSQSAKMVQYGILKREAEINRTVYEATLQKGEEASIASAMRATNARVVNPAFPPSDPYKPDPILYSVIGLLSGLLVGATGVLIREHTDRNIRSPGDAAWYAHVRELGVIPSARIDPGFKSFANGHGSNGALTGGHDSKTGSNGRRAGRSRDSSVELATWMRKPSLIAESFRGTLASILLSRENGGSPGPSVMVVTSPNPREGKSTVISNLAITLAELGYRVLLVDADIRRPRLHKIFNRLNNWGLTDLLSATTPVDEYPVGIARDTDIPGVYLLPAGPRTSSPPVGLFHSERFSALLNRFRVDFDLVLIDTGPVLHLADTRLMSRHADGVILVFRARQTSREAAVAAAQRLQEDGSIILGSILNDWDPSTAGYSYYNSDYYRQYSEDAVTKRQVRVRLRIGHS